MKERVYETCWPWRRDGDDPSIVLDVLIWIWAYLKYFLCTFMKILRANIMKSQNARSEGAKYETNDSGLLNTPFYFGLLSEKESMFIVLHSE